MRSPPIWRPDTGAWKRTTERPMSSQSLMTPATFMVSAEVLPTIRYTAMFSPKATRQLARNMPPDQVTLGSLEIFGSSMKTKGTSREKKQAGETRYMEVMGFVLLYGGIITVII